MKKKEEKRYFLPGFESKGERSDTATLKKVLTRNLTMTNSEAQGSYIHGFERSALVTSDVRIRVAC